MLVLVSNWKAHHFADFCRIGTSSVILYFRTRFCVVLLGLSAVTTTCVRAAKLSSYNNNTTQYKYITQDTGILVGIDAQHNREKHCHCHVVVMVVVVLPFRWICDNLLGRGSTNKQASFTCSVSQRTCPVWSRDTRRYRLHYSKGLGRRYRRRYRRRRRSSHGRPVQGEIECTAQQYTTTYRTEPPPRARAVVTMFLAVTL